jgi:hypothetical protein
MKIQIFFISLWWYGQFFKRKSKKSHMLHKLYTAYHHEVQRKRTFFSYLLFEVYIWVGVEKHTEEIRDDRNILFRRILTKHLDLLASNASKAYYVGLGGMGNGRRIVGVWTRPKGHHYQTTWRRHTRNPPTAMGEPWVHEAQMRRRWKE